MWNVPCLRQAYRHYLSSFDGGNPVRHMDWRCTQNYVKAFANAEEVQLRTSWRVNGFFGELYRIGASEPIEWMEPDTGEILQCKPTAQYLRCSELKKQVTENIEAELIKYGYRMKFPAKSADLNRRWCSAYLKICVADSVIRNMDSLMKLADAGGQCFPAKGSTHEAGWCSGSLKAAVQNSVIPNLSLTRQDTRILVVSGERRGESAGRSRYNEMEWHRTNATVKSHRLVHLWRAVIDYSEADIWEVNKRHKVNPHPCYRCGWNRCSCAMCIFSMPSHFAGIREIMPEEYAQLRQDEIILGFTIDNRRDLDTYVGSAESCVYHGDESALRSLISGEFTVDDIYIEGPWKYPAGAFHGAEGGPC